MTDSRKRSWVALAGGVVLLLLVAGAAARYFGPDPQLEKVRQLRAQLTSEAGRNLKPEERRERWQQLGEEMKKLSPEQRGELFQERQREYMKGIDRYFSLPKKDQVAHLDRAIDRMEAGRKRMEAAREKARQGTSASVPKAGPGGPGGNRPSLTPEQREQRRKDRLDRSTPEERAKMAEYRKQLEARRKQRGLPPSLWGGR